MDTALVARSLAWLTVGLVAADVVVSAQTVRLTSETAVAVHGFPFIHGAVVGSAVMGALILSRYARHPIGWLLSGAGAVGALSLVTEAYAYWVQEGDGPGSAALGGVFAWASTLFGGQLIIASLALMFLLAPDGHLLSPRWRYAAWLTATGASLCLLAVLSISPAAFRLTTGEDDIGAVRQTTLTVGFLAILVGLVLSVVSMLVRLRRSRDEQRQQLRLIALAAALPTFGVICLLVVQLLNGGHQTWAASLPLSISYFLLPILFAIAALRHRLYDLDVIINRTVVLVTGVAFAAVGYTALVVAVGRVVEDTGRGFWLSLVGTAVVALAFQPLRRSVVRLANRLAYGRRAQPYEALADFSRQLADAPPPGTLLPAVAESAARAVSARSATASLDIPGAEPLRGTWGKVGAESHPVAVRLDGRVLGSIAVGLPRGRTLTDADRAVLEAVADQAAVAFRNTVLASELAARVEELDRTTRQLVESRLRLVEADDAARRGLEAAIARDLLPLVADLPARIARVRASLPGGPASSEIDALVEDTNIALGSLRDLSRGVFPAQLARAGLEPAVRSMLARAAGSPILTINGIAGRRFPPRVEAALYFCCLETVRSCADASVTLADEGENLCLRVEGIDAQLLDLTVITDRIGAAGGSVRVDGQVLLATVPASPMAPEATATVVPQG